MLRLSLISLVFLAISILSAPVEKSSEDSESAEVVALEVVGGPALSADSGESVELTKGARDFWAPILRSLVQGVVDHEAEVRNATKTLIGALAGWGFELPTDNVDKELDEFFKQAKLELSKNATTTIELPAIEAVPVAARR